MLSILLSVLLLAFCTGTFNSITVSAASITMTVSSSIATDILPTNPNGTVGSSDTTTSNVSITTDNTTGYTLSLSSSSATAPALTGDNGSISSITTEQSAISNFTSGTWGYKPTKKNGSTWEPLSVTSGSTTYNAGYFLPAPTTTGDTLDTTEEANSTVNEYNIAIATKVGSETAVGSYSSNFIVTAVTNLSGITVTYDAQGGNFSGASTNVMTYDQPQSVTYPEVTVNGSTTNSTTASGTYKTSITDTTQYVSSASYYQDLVLSTDAPGPYSLTIYYATESVSFDWICVFDGTSYTPGSGDACTNSSAIAPATNSGSTSGNKIGGGGSSKTAYVNTATYQVTSKTARIYFRSDGSGNSYGFWAVFTGGGTKTTQNLVSGSYLEPTKDNAVFLGWSTTEGATTPDWTYDSSTIYNENTTIYAVWFDTSSLTSFDTAFANAGKTKDTTTSLYKMQDMSSPICSAVTTPIASIAASVQVAQLVDTRDGNTYYVSKLPDGKCWMLDNLRLGGTSTISLTSSDTNIASNYTLPASGTVCFTSSSCTGTSGATGSGYTVAAINSASKDTTTTSYGSGSGKIGVYYNYCAASAGTICTSSNSSSTTYDICPKNWRMPTGGSSGEYQALYTAYSSNITNFKTALSTPLSGVFSYGSAGYQGSYGYFWSSTYYNSSDMYNLYVYASHVNPTHNRDRYIGSSVRCVAQ